MIIKNITIENFQSYYGKQSLDFSEGLNIVVGNGGKGKSKLFNAFYWVLFGKIYITDVGWCSTDSLPFAAPMQRHEFINFKALSETEINTEVTTKVQLEFEDDKGLVYLIERYTTALRKDNGEIWRSSNAWDVKDNTLKISYESLNGTKINNGIGAEDKINELFPKGIHNYIWFQGESLDSLINFRKKETLKAAVKHISYFPYYEKLSEIIELAKIKISQTENRKKKEVNKQNSTLNEILSKISRLNYLIEKEEGNKNEIIENINLIQQELTKDENRMSGMASYSNLVKKYKDCEFEISQINNKIFDLDKFQRNQLPSLWVLRSIEPLVEKCKEIIAKHTEEEYTVPEKKYLDNPSRTKLEEILRDGRCFVCGSKVSEGNEAYHYILERLRLQDEYLKEMEDYQSNMLLSKQFNMFIGKIQDYPEDLMRSLPNIDKQWQKSEDELEKLMALRRKKKREKEAFDEEIDNIKRKYNVNPVEQAEIAGRVSSSIRATRSNLERFENKLRTSEETIKDYKRNLKELEKESSKLESKDSSFKSVPETEWKNISTFLEPICKKVQENARKELLRKIEERANIFYTKFTEHDNGYKGDVKINDDYTIEFDPVLNTSHEDRKKMSIINALLSLNQEAMNIYYPFISDAPTSSFDPETSLKYLLGIKDIFGQSIIMTKDVDLESDKYQDLVKQNHIGRIYKLESELYCDCVKPDLHEVSTKIKPIK